MAAKDVVRTERAPAPFQGAPYNQAIVVGDLVFVAGQLGLAPGAKEMVGPGITEQTEQVMQNLAAILEEAGSGVANRRDERRLRDPRRRPSAGTFHGAGRGAPVGRPGRDRGRRPPLTEPECQTGTGARDGALVRESEQCRS